MAWVLAPLNLGKSTACILANTQLATVEPVSPLTLTEKTLPLVPRIRNSRSSFFTLGARCASSRRPPPAA